MALDLSNWISEIRTSADWGKIAPRLGPMFTQLQDAINQGFASAGVDATSTRQRPAPPAHLNVKVAGELAHVSISDYSQRSRNLHYFLEYATNPQFSSPYVEHMGVSRNRVLNLPTKDDSGNTQSWFFRSYSMEPGSTKASSKVYYGQALAPTAVQMAGSTHLTLLPSTGAGTAPTDGQKSGQGFGTAQVTRSNAKT